MVRASARKLFTLWLGFFFALSLTLSAVQASAMTCDMGMAVAMEKAGHAGNPDCAQTTHKRAVQSCLAKCVAPAPSMLPEGTARPFGLASVAFALPHDQPLTGRVSSPDPPPPRSVS